MKLFGHTNYYNYKKTNNLNNLGVFVFIKIKMFESENTSDGLN